MPIVKTYIRIIRIKSTITYYLNLGFFLSFFFQLAEVNVGGLVCSAVLSPLSHSTALLTVLQPEIPQQNQLLKTNAEAPQTTTDLPDVVSSVLGVVYDIMNNDEDAVNGRNTDMQLHIQVIIN